MPSTIRQIAERIAAADRKRHTLAAALRKAGPDLFIPTAARQVDGRVVGVDGGLVKKSFHGFDLLLGRAAGVCFEYQKGVIRKVSYWPPRIPPIQPELSEEANETDWVVSSALRRLKTEVTATLRSLELFHPDVLLVHGPVIPHYADKPSKTSPAYDLYGEVRDLYRTLYENLGDTLFAGVIEDTRGSLFCDYAGTQKQLDGLMGNRDSNVLAHAMHQGERTISIPLSPSPELHPVLKDFSSVGEQLSSFFLKVAAYDRPLRVDFYRHGMEDRLAGILLSLSGSHRGYSMPAPIIEADNVARIPETEMDNTYAQIMSLAQVSGMLLRREQRPF